MGEPSANQNSVAWNDWPGKISDSVRVVGQPYRAGDAADRARTFSVWRVNRTCAY